MKLKIWTWLAPILNSLLKQVILRLTMADGKEGLTWEDFTQTVEWIKRAEEAFDTGEERREWVMAQIETFREKKLPHVKEWLFWTALNYAKEKGYIILGNVLEEFSGERKPL